MELVSVRMEINHFNHIEAGVYLKLTVYGGFERKRLISNWIGDHENRNITNGSEL